MSVVSLEGVTRSYIAPWGVVQALDNVTLRIEPGEFVAVVGPSGSGKSTLLSLIGGMALPEDGRVLVDEIDIHDMTPDERADLRRNYVGFVFQQLQLVPYLTALENVMLPLLVSKQKDGLQERAQGALAKVGLADKARHLPDQLSGGEQQRVAVARAMVGDPPILLADEPTGNLDSRTGQEIVSLFQELSRQGQTILMVTHNEEAAGIADRVIMLRDGQIVEERIQNDDGFVDADSPANLEAAADVLLEARQRFEEERQPKGDLMPIIAVVMFAMIVFLLYSQGILSAVHSH